MTRFLLLGGTDEFRESVESAYASGAPVDIELMKSTSYEPDVVLEIVRVAPDLVAVGPAINDGDALKFVEEIDRVAPQISVVMIADSSSELWPEALRAGVRDIISPLTTGAKLRDCLDRAVEAGRRLRDSITEDIELDTVRIIAVISPKGGSGKTMVASNLAVTIARSHPDQTVLADLDVQFGDVRYAFSLESEYSLLHAVGDGVTPTMLKGFLTPHSTKVLALAAPDNPEDADDIPAARAAATIHELAALFQFVVVDTSAGITEHILAVLEVATDVVLVTATDVPSVRAVVKELDILERLGLLAGRTQHLVLNRADARVGLSLDDIAETVGLDVALAIPSNRAIPAALNLGEPYVSTDEHSPVARKFTKFAEQFTGVEAQGSVAWWPWRKVT